MSKNKLTKKEQEELEIYFEIYLQKAIDDIMKEAKDVVEDYTKNPSEISGSMVHVNQNSPYLDEAFKDDSWKKVIKGSVEDALQLINKKNIKKKKKKA